MKQIHDFAASLTIDLSISRASRKRIHAEIVDHLCEEASALREAGCDEEEAAKESIARFGPDDVLREMIDGSLEQESKRYRLLQKTSHVMTVTVGIWLALILGAWFSAFDDSVGSGHGTPHAVWQVVYGGAAVLAIVALVMIAGLIFRGSVRLTIVGGLLVVVAFAATMAVYNLTSLQSVFYIHAGQDRYVTAAQQFGMRLYLCWGPTVLITIGLFIAGRGPMMNRLRLIAELGLLSAILWGGRLLAIESQWLIPWKWPKLASTGLLAVVFVLVLNLTSRGMRCSDGNASRLMPDQS